MTSRWRLLQDIFKYRTPLLALASNYLTFVHDGDSGFWGGMSGLEESALVKVLFEHCLDEGPIVEFGTLFGFSSLLLAANKGKSQELYTVDNFSWNPFILPRTQHVEFTRRCLRSVTQDKTVVLIEDEITNFCSTWNHGRPAMVFIDASHDYQNVSREIAWARFVRAKVICGHDFGKRWPGVTQAVQENFANNIVTTGSFWYSVC